MSYCLNCFHPIAWLAVLVALPGESLTHFLCAEEASGRSALATDSQGWLDLMPAPGLSGWTRIAIPPTNALGRAQWHLDSALNVLICDGDGGHDMLRHNTEWTNCILHVECRFLPVASTNRNYNSGVFIRNSADGVIWHQCQLTGAGGYLFGDTVVAGERKRLKLNARERRLKPAGEWNTVELTARGPTLDVWLNGAITCEFNGCEVARGYVALESEGYAIEFRNLKLKPLP